MSHTIFIRTYAKDADWLHYCLTSCRRVSPESPIIVVCPKDSHEAIHPLAQEFGAAYDTLNPLHEDGYMDQQYTKLHADQWVHTEYVVHLDSDCVMLRPAADLFFNGLPTMIKTPWEDLGPDAVWRDITREVVGFDPPFEFMRRQPLVYPRSVYALFRAYLSSNHGGTLAQWFAGLSGRRFSEFNALGAFCHAFLPESFHWVNTATDPLPAQVARQGWSWGGLVKVRKEWDQLVSGYAY
jgi:hypothetical protein